MSPESLEQHRPVSIGEHAIIGDCRTAALVARDGTVDWLCLPDFSSPSVFGSLLDKEGGQFALHPVGDSNAVQSYIGDTPVLQTEFTTASGSFRLTDTMIVLDGVHPMRPLRELLRKIDGLAGEVETKLVIDFRPDYGRSSPRLQFRKSIGWCWSWNNSLAVLRSEIPFKREGRSLVSSVPLRAGDRHFISLSFVQDDPAIFPTLGRDAEMRLDQTIAWWTEWAGRCSYQGPHREAVIRSAITLELLSHAPSGAVIAAPTTSLPETVGGDRNWDYRYCWLRDAGMTAQAFIGLSYHQEARAFLNWLLHATRLTWPELRVVYDVYGRTNIPEQQLDHWSGYRCSRPVRLGNGAVDQRQLDAYGQAAIAADTVSAAGVKLDAVEGRMLRGFGKAVCKLWREPDSGIWEIRSTPRHYTLSKAMCWAALDRLVAMDKRGAIALGAYADRFERERDSIRDVIETRGLNPSTGAYSSELDRHQVDASLLLLPCIGYIDAADERMRRTYSRVWEELATDNLLYRYPRGYDGSASKEGAFGICCFWAVETLAKIGAIDEAEALYESVLKRANPLGLFGEEIDPVTGEALGNFPQAFTHVGVINAALAIEQARKAN